MTVRILTGDCRNVLKTLPDNSVDSIVTDPPYELTSKRPGGRSEATRGKVMGGFMGMKWDGTGVAFDPETWRQALRVLKPGGFLIAFGGTRTYHRLACAIEDGGFDVRDMLGWLYGSGFPKGTDKAKIPAAWKGWNTALKPALEPACLARKPMEGSLAENLAKWGTGALWIDGCRIETDDDLNGGAYAELGARAISNSLNPSGMNVPGKTVGTEFIQPPGRWPANVMHDGSEEVLDAFPFAPGAVAPVTGQGLSGAVFGAPGTTRREASDRRDGGGSAARFFYTAKASRFDRNEGLEGLPEKPLLWSSGEANPGSFQSPNTKRAAANNHPTVKPTDLMRYLCRLVTPPGGTVLDPFMGSGSTLKAAELEGFRGIGIELDPAYVAIAQRRISADAPLFAQVES